MDELNACTECGFTTKSILEFTSHIETHEMEHRSSSGENSQSAEWATGSSSASSTPSPTGSLSSEENKTPSPRPRKESEDDDKNSLLNLEDAHLLIAKLEPTLIKDVCGTTNGNGKSSKTIHSCPHCNFTTFMSQHMKSHLEAHERHQGAMYQCDICQMQFSQKANMHRHRMRHSGVKPYECRYCKKRFFRKDQMQEHSMTHIKTGADFDCPVLGCSKQFGQHAQLRTHLDDSHNITSSNPASCKRCSLLFSNSRRLLLHYQTRHDENESSASEINEPTPKRRKREIEPINLLPKNSSLTEQIQRMVKQEAIETPVISSSVNELLQQRVMDFAESSKMPTTFPISSEDILMMCLANQTSFAQTALMPNNVTLDQTLRLWSDQSGTSTQPSQTEEPHSPSCDSGSSNIDVVDDPACKLSECTHCGITFIDETMHLLHKGLHTEDEPFKCNLCGLQCCDKYAFSTHIIFASHSTGTV